jgi:signal peptidase I
MVVFRGRKRGLAMEDKSRDEIPSTGQLEELVRKKKYRRDYIHIFLTTVESLVVVAAVAVLIATLVLPVLRVTGNSMNPTLYNDQLVICRKQGNFKQGDIIAFYYNNKILLKRVIATEGDVVNIASDGTVYVNDVALEEDYLSEKSYGECDITFPYQVPADRVFVLGDNRATSIDSRSSEIGCVAEENVLGIVMFRIWPLKDMGKP